MGLFKSCVPLAEDLTAQPSEAAVDDYMKNRPSHVGKHLNTRSTL